MLSHWEQTATDTQVANLFPHGVEVLADDADLQDGDIFYSRSHPQTPPRVWLWNQTTGTYTVLNDRYGIRQANWRVPNRSSYQFLRPKETTMTDVITPEVETPEEVNPFQAELNEARVARDWAQRRAEAIEEDFHRLADALLDEAHSRDWCSEYDSFVDRISGSLREMSMPTRETEYNVRFNVTLNGTSDMDDLRSRFERWIDGQPEVATSGDYDYERA